MYMYGLGEFPYGLQVLVCFIYVPKVESNLVYTLRYIMEGEKDRFDLFRLDLLYCRRRAFHGIQLIK